MTDALPTPLRPKLPNMNEFSPSVVGELGQIFSVVAKNAGDRGRLRAAIVNASLTIKPRPNDQHLVRADNVLIGMSQCGLFNLPTNQLTPLGLQLAAETDDARRHDLFARHLLTFCHGNDLFTIVRSLVAKRETISTEAIRSELKARGFVVTVNEGNASKIRLWLEKARVVDANWVINEERYIELMGLSMTAREEWQEITRGQQAFLNTLKEVTAGAVDKWLMTSYITELCIERWGPHLLPKEADRRARLIDPLEQAGWLEARGVGGGRGGKGGEIKATRKLIEAKMALEVDPPRPSGIPKELIKKLDTPLADIYRDLESTDKYVKGIALELLCLRLCHSLGLNPVELRKRGVKTQGAEVDLIAEGVGLHYSRWMFQCKNTPHSAVDVEDLAKEIGLAMLLKAHVVVMVTTGRFTRVVKQFSGGVSKETYLQTILIDGSHLAEIRKKGEAHVFDIVRAQAQGVLTLKASQLFDVIGEDAGAAR